MSRAFARCLVGIGLLLVVAPTIAKDTRPNILFIIADDLGWADVGYHGSKIETPSIDRLARDGVRLEQHYVQPMCSPTRAALLSGRYPSRFGVLAATNEQVFPLDSVTLPAALKTIGYHTSLSGKWHLGSKPEWGPLKFGFDRAYGSLAGGVGPYNHRYKKGPFSFTWHRNHKLIEEEGHVTDLIAKEVIEWIEARRQPWFIYVPFTAVHIPVAAPERWIKHYEGKIENESYRRYAAYTTQMDDAIGQMIEALNRTGQRKNTLVVFTSDNGSTPSWRPRGRYPGEHKPCPVLGSNLPLRGHKATLYEGGIRVPTAVNWPGVLEAGKIVDSPVHVVDWMPTLCRLAGYEPDSDLQWDGRDIWPLLSGEVQQAEPRVLYWRFTGGRTAIREADWKLLLGKDGRRAELFNLAEDPYEKQNLAKQYPERVAKLKALLPKYRQDDQP